MKTIPTFALLSIFALPTLRAQTAEGFDTSGMVPASPSAQANAKAAPAPAPAAGKQAPAPAAVKAEVKKVPSRYAGSGPEMAAYIEAYSSRFGIKGRQTDMFGRIQDPNYVAQIPQTPKPGGPKLNYPKIPQTPFPDVVAAIEVNTIDLSKRRFYVGGREFRMNSVLSLRLGTGRQVKAQVIGITSKSITFRNPETAETAIKQMEMMPAGMTRGTEGISAPGLQRTGDNAPLEVDVAPPSPPISSK